MDIAKAGFCALVVILWVLLLAGCTTWTHTTKDEGGFYRDLYDCEVQAAPVIDDWRALQMKRRCMQLKGWKSS